MNKDEWDKLCVVGDDDEMEQLAEQAKGMKQEDIEGEFDRIQDELGKIAKKEAEKSQGMSRLIEACESGGTEITSRLVDRVMRQQAEEQGRLEEQHRRDRQAVEGGLVVANDQRMAEVIDVDSVQTARQLKAFEARQVYKSRTLDKRQGLFTFRDTGKFAVDKRLAADQFHVRSRFKPRWAVVGCVWLRAGGLCEVCTESVDTTAKVKQLQQPKHGGVFNEPNCLLVCKNCDKVWPAKTLFEMGVGSVELAELDCFVLSRRNNGAKGSKYLNEKSHKHWLERRAKLEMLVLKVQEGLGVKKVEPDKKVDGVPSCLLA